MLFGEEALQTPTTSILAGTWHAGKHMKKEEAKAETWLGGSVDRGCPNTSRLWLPIPVRAHTRINQ